MAISALSSDQKRQALSIFKDVEFHRLTAYTEDNFPPPATSEQKCSPDHKVQRPVVTSTYLADGARVWAPGRLSEEHTRPSFAGIPDIPHQLKLIAGLNPPRVAVMLTAIRGASVVLTE
ncbi:Hypothetical predicted protein [Pelobates cultripes]|uniref:Uncharacterized protein n=1 Tax=Pelobates cultripes TaxID=61616 RepID=A0AAD1WLA9_PELCU|nr:Hypothetical predicted protein [Pelobates cultripes]